MPIMTPASAHLCRVSEHSILTNLHLPFDVRTVLKSEIEQYPYGFLMWKMGGYSVSPAIMHVPAAHVKVRFRNFEGVG